MVTGQLLIKNTGMESDNKKIFVITGLLMFSETEQLPEPDIEYNMVGSGNEIEQIYLTLIPIKKGKPNDKEL